VISQIDPTGAPLTTEQAALVTALAMLAGGGVAGALGQNVIGAATSAENESLNNSGKHVGTDLVSQVCGSIGPSCSDATVQELTQAQAQLSTQATANMELGAPYVAGGLGVALLGPEAIAAAAAGGTYDYLGNVISYGLGHYGFGPVADPPSFSNSYIAGVVAGLTYPLAISDAVIAGLGTPGRIAATGYNAFVAGTGAFGATAITSQTSSPDLSSGLAVGGALLGAGGKLILPGPLASAFNTMMQILPGPTQNAIESSKKN
jgi:filamentous hemagglutinin